MSLTKVLISTVVILTLLLVPIGTAFKYRLIGTTIGVSVVMFSSEKPKTLDLVLGAVAGYLSGELVYALVHDKNADIKTGIKKVKEGIIASKTNIKDLIDKEK